MGPGWRWEGDTEPERPDSIQDLSASFSKECKRITTLGDIEGIFVIKESACDATGRRQEERQELQRSTRWPVPHSPVSRQA